MANLRANKITSTEVFETTGSVQFDGDGDYLSLASSADFNFGTGDFTLECWIYALNLSGVDKCIVEFRGSSVSTDGWVWFINSNNVMQIYDNSVYSASSGIISISQWNHLSICRKNGVLTYYLNGISSGSVNYSSSTNASSTGIRIATRQDTTNSFNGHISNLRILKGTALYTKNFTPPTRELTVIPNTVLLACTSTTNAAQEATGKTITVNGNAVANELTPGLLTDRVKSGGTSAITGSVEFDGTGPDFLSVENNNDFAFGLDDFTVEFWVYPVLLHTFHQIFDTRGTTSSSLTGFSIGYTAGNFYIYTNTFLIQSSNTLNSWSHISVTRRNGTFYLFINGINSGTYSASTYNLTNSIPYIGSTGTADSSQFFKGFISNLRIIKGTALYTSDFIPPTRELKNIPGTVLLCCKNSNDPTTEATGKTITPYGDLDRTDLGVELVTNGGFSSASDWTQGGTNATIGSGVLSLSSAVYNTDYQEQSITFKIGSTYVLTFDILNYSSGGAQIDIAGQKTLIGTPTASANGSYRVIFTPPTNTPTQTFRISGNGTLDLDNVSVTKLDPGTKPAFTPQVGSDGSVEFAGPTKINSENYFYLPTGNTESRGRGRGVFGGGGEDPSPASVNVVDYIDIQSQGNAIDFGDLSQSRGLSSSCSSNTRGIFGGGGSPTSFNIIDYITISSTSNAKDFGDLSSSTRSLSACSSNTRGIFGGGYTPTSFNSIYYVTIASTGNTTTFGNLSQGGFSLSSCSSTTRGLFGGGVSPSISNIIDYITISSVGNAQDFGDLSSPRYLTASCSSNTRGVFGGGYAPGNINIIDYVTISTTGNAQDFGDLTVSRRISGSCSSNIRGVFGGGFTSVNSNTIDFIIISTTGNAQDFGDLTEARYGLAGCSDSHGGLG
jgi:hypothetical protein